MGVRRLLLGKADGRRYLILWQNANSYDELRRQDRAVSARAVTLAFPVTLNSVSVYTPLTGTTAEAVFRAVRTITVNVPDHPVVVELRD